MFKAIFFPTLLALTISTAARAQSKDEQAIAATAEQLRAAMVKGDSAQLAALTLPQLSYGHSGGHIDNQAEFVYKIISGKSDFVTIDISDQHIDIVRDVAVVRHKFHATTNDNGKAGVVDLNVMLIWQKYKKDWKLLARQAVKAK